MGFDFAGYFKEIALTSDLLAPRDERPFRVAPPRDGERHDVVLYLGCNVMRTSHMIQTVTQIFDRLGVDYAAVGGPTYCCGIQHENHGQPSSAEKYAHHTIELFEKMAPREVVMWCPSCIYFYDEVLGAKLPFPTRFPAEFLLERLPRFTFTHRVDARVAMHDHHVHPVRRREGQAGRKLLEAVPGISLVDFESDPRWGRSCTPALVQQLGEEAWTAMAVADIDRALAAGATHLAGIYHGCHRMNCGFEAARPVTIEHYLTLFGRGLGIEVEDTYKKYRLMGDPERVLEEMTPCMAANGVDPERARSLVVKTFPKR
ncbi:MAG: (Fe-S)-binding protein [Candidatus Rokubacteria bacterium]|nr:(Fe-S)-binding protein [Candidatus Rokubacteria bacterium]